MFDLAKGLGILTIVMTHVLTLFGTARYDEITPGWIIPYVLFKRWNELLMPVFFLVSGITFAPMTMKKCMKKNGKELMKPYLVTGVLTVFFFILVHYGCFRYLPGTLGEARRIIISYILGVAAEIYFNGEMFFSVGAVWFLPALFLGHIVLNMLFQILPEDKIKWGVLALAIPASFIGWVGRFPLCLAQGMVAVAYLYAGFILKKEKLLMKAPSPKQWCLMAIPVGVWIFFGEIGFADGYFKLGFLDVAATGFAGYLLILLTSMCREHHGFIMDGIRMLGRNSLWIICMDSLLTHVVPWYLIINSEIAIWKAFIICFVIRWSIILVALQLQSKVGRYIRKQRRAHKKRAAAR